MTNADKPYSIKLNRCSFSSVYGVNREIENLQGIIKVFEAEASACEYKERENRIKREKKEQEERMMREKLEQAERIMNEHAVLMKIVSDNPIIIDTFNAAMNRTTVEA